MQAKFLATRDALRKAKVADDTVKVLTLARAHAAFYETAKAQRGALDFPDLVARAAALLTQSGAAAWVLYKLDGGVDHVLIDEAQDTAPEQWAIVRALTGEILLRRKDRPHRLRRRRRETVDLFLPGRPARAAASGTRRLPGPGRGRG
nr:UvrD-helicase domain-containing protein [uncultured Brevundimonas sp.]